MANTPDEIEEEETAVEPPKSMADLIHERKLPLSDLYYEEEIPDGCGFGRGGMY